MESVPIKIETHQLDTCLETVREEKQNTAESCHQAQNTDATLNTEMPILESSSSLLLTGDSTKLSKRAQKRLQKKALYESYKKEKRYCFIFRQFVMYFIFYPFKCLLACFSRAKERENRKKRKRENPIDQSALGRGNRKKLKETTMAKSSCKLGIVIDLSFDQVMDEKSLAKTIKQVARCYSVNRRAVNPVQFHVCSLGTYLN